MEDSSSSSIVPVQAPLADHLVGSQAPSSPAAATVTAEAAEAAAAGDTAVELANPQGMSSASNIESEGGAQNILEDDEASQEQGQGERPAFAFLG